MSKRFSILCLCLLMPLFASCGAKKTVRIPSYWPDARPVSADDAREERHDDHRGPAKETDAPVLSAAGHEMKGLASWYGIPYHGQKTASGETYDMHAMTAAHRTLPFDTRVRVTHLQTKEQIVVRINDRGPFVDGRVIDLSREAADRLQMVRAGLAPVRIDQVPDETLPIQDSAIYTVQVGFFEARPNAVRLYGDLKKRYEKVVVEPDNSRGYRVRVGEFPTRAEAEQLQRQLKQEEFSGFVRILE